MKITGAHFQIKPINMEEWWTLSGNDTSLKGMSYNLTHGGMDNMMDFLKNGQGEIGEAGSSWLVEAIRENGSHLGKISLQPLFVKIPPPELHTVKIILHNIKLYFTPILVVAGVIGNCIGATVMLTTKLRKLSCAIYLAAIAVTNSSFLAALFMIWLTKLNIHLYNTAGWCQFVTLISCACNLPCC